MNVEDRLFGKSSSVFRIASGDKSFSAKEGLAYVVVCGFSFTNCFDHAALGPAHQ